MEEVDHLPSKTRPARYPGARSALPGVLPGLTGLPPRGRSEADAAEGGGSRSSSSRSRSRRRSRSWSLRPQEAMAGSGRRQHTGPHPAPNAITATERAPGRKGTGSAMRPTAREQGWGTALEKVRSWRLQKTRCRRLRQGENCPGARGLRGGDAGSGGGRGAGARAGDRELRILVRASLAHSPPDT